MELDLGLALPHSNPHLDLDLNYAPAAKKRAFTAAFAPGGGDEKRPPLDTESEDEVGSGSERLLVGWPPVKWPRLHGCGCGGGGRLARRVKVGLEGRAVGRKVDLATHRSYRSLLRALDRMFGTSSQDGWQIQEGAMDDERAWRRRSHVVTYEDADGDWMLVGDVPWESFVESVKRLKIISNRAEGSHV